MTDHLAQTPYLIAQLEEARWSGCHSIELRRSGISNPSQRATDAVTLRGHELRKRREKLGDAWGIRIWLARYAPTKSERIEPDDRAELAGGADFPPESVEPVRELGAEAPAPNPDQGKVHYRDRFGQDHFEFPAVVAGLRALDEAEGGQEADPLGRAA